MPKKAQSEAKLLLKLKKPQHVKVYMPVFRPLAAAQYLDPAALKKIKKAVIEIGSLDAPGGSINLSVEIVNGKAKRLIPGHCESCGKARKGGKKKQLHLIQAVSRELAGLEPIPVPVPESIAMIGGGALGCFGPIIIVIGPDDPGNPHPGCVYIWTPGQTCWYCDGFTCCVTPTDPMPTLPGKGWKPNLKAKDLPPTLMG